MNSTPNRRKFLGQATAFLAGIGVTLATIPFIRSLLPAADKSVNNLHQIDISKIRPGELIATYTPWGRQVYVLSRTPQILDGLKYSPFQLADPESLDSVQPEKMTNWHRSKSEDLLVVYSHCTHLGCEVGYLAPGLDRHASSEHNQAGSFFCPCHGSRYDLAGRVGIGYPAPKNLEVPQYEFTEGILTIFRA